MSTRGWSLVRKQQPLTTLQSRPSRASSASSTTVPSKWPPRTRGQQGRRAQRLWRPGPSAAAAHAPEPAVVAVWAGPGSEHFRPVEQGSTLRSAATDFVPVTLRPAASAPVHRPTTLSSMWPFCRAPPGLSAATPAGPQCAAPVMAVSGLHVPDGGQQAASPERQGEQQSVHTEVSPLQQLQRASPGLRSRARRPPASGAAWSLWGGRGVRRRTAATATDSWHGPVGGRTPGSVGGSRPPSGGGPTALTPQACASNGTCRGSCTGWLRPTGGKQQCQLLPRKSRGAAKTAGAT